MRGSATWIVASAVLVLLLLAVADGIRSRAGASGAQAPPPGILHGVIVTADAACQTHAFRLPSLAAEHAPHPPDCNGLKWSQDGSIVARCNGDSTSVRTSDGVRFPNVHGCAPAWRVDGALSVVVDGSIVIARRHGAPFIVFSRAQLTEALGAAGVEDPGAWRLAQVSWFGLTSFVAILQRPGDSAAAVFAQGGLETFVPHIGAHIEDLRVSPIGNFAFARVDPEREYVMLSRGGDPIRLPVVRGATAIGWSPDEHYVTVSTDDETVVARTGTTDVVATLAFGARALDWLS
jgi:hypothetical protein